MNSSSMNSNSLIPFTAYVMALLSGVVAAEGKELKPISISSPDGTLTAVFRLTTNGEPRYLIQRDGWPVLGESRLGLIRDDADFSKGLRVESSSRTESVRDSYEILTTKRRLNTYRANRKVVHLRTATGQKLDVIFQVSNDGVAFRYFFPETSTNTHKLIEEVSSFQFSPGTKAWLQPI